MRPLSLDAASPLHDTTDAAAFRNHTAAAAVAGWIKMPLGIEVGPGHVMLDGGPAPPLRKRGHRRHNFRPMLIVAKRLDGSRCDLALRWAQATLC